MHCLVRTEVIQTNNAILMLHEGEIDYLSQPALLNT